MTGIKDVAREAGVSASTVSYVLSGKRSISAKTTEKVMAAVDKLGYTPDASARKMRGMRNQLIALSSPIRGDINKARYNAYFLHTAWAARNAGYDVMLLTGPDATKDIRRVTQSNLVDGVVLLDVEQDDERAAAAMTFPKPCVAIGYPSSHAGCACVDIDFALMGRKA
ncbi:LacI family DNA-binding transcriptional regulator, partial [Bacteroides uniformis]|nr:LacI family DNA-binding transcriptional regulator [Bacteroides uniformis]